MNLQVDPGKDAFINIKYMIPTYQSFGSWAVAFPCRGREVES